VIRAVIDGDYHCGHVLGLTPPDWWQKKTLALSRAVWEWRAEELRKIGRVDVHVALGDLVDGPGKKETIGLLTTDMDEQAEMAFICAGVVRAKHRYICYGTPLHTVSTLSHETAVARLLDSPIRETWRLKMGGKRFHFRHVVGRSDVPYGQGTQVAKEIVREELQALAESYEPAEVFGRGHAHYWYRVETASKTAFICPALELPNPDEDGNIYARKLRTMYYNVGFVLIEIDSTGEVYIRPRIMPLKLAIRKEYTCPLEAKKRG
jgi:hypothetical protein